MLHPSTHSPHQAIILDNIQCVAIKILDALSTYSPSEGCLTGMRNMTYDYQSVNFLSKVFVRAKPSFPSNLASYCTQYVTDWLLEAKNSILNENYEFAPTSMNCYCHMESIE